MRKLVISHLLFVIAALSAAGQSSTIEQLTDATTIDAGDKVWMADVSAPTASRDVDATLEQIVSPFAADPSTNQWFDVAAWKVDLGYLATGDPLAWGDLTGTPTTLGGYGITDAYTISGADAAFEPLGVAAADITDSTATGQSLITAADAESVRDAASLTQSNSLLEPTKKSFHIPSPDNNQLYGYEFISQISGTAGIDVDTPISFWRDDLRFGLFRNATRNLADDGWAAYDADSGIQYIEMGGEGITMHIVPAGSEANSDNPYEIFQMTMTHPGGWAGEFDADLPYIVPGLPLTIPFTSDSGSAGNFSQNRPINAPLLADVYQQKASTRAGEQEILPLLMHTNTAGDATGGTGTQAAADIIFRRADGENLSGIKNTDSLTSTPQVGRDILGIRGQTWGGTSGWIDVARYIQSVDYKDGSNNGAAHEFQVARDGTLNAALTIQSDGNIKAENKISIGKDVDTAVALSIESLLRTNSSALKITDSEAPNAFLRIGDLSSQAGKFTPLIHSQGEGVGTSSHGLRFIATPGQDGSDDAAFLFDGRNPGSALTEAPVFSVSNYVNELFKISHHGGLEIKTNTDAAATAIKLDQNDLDQGFIEFSGDGTIPADTSENISSQNGDGSVEGPKSYGTTNGWQYEGMVKIKVNGSDFWMPYYSPDVD